MAKTHIRQEKTRIEIHTDPIRQGIVEMVLGILPIGLYFWYCSYLDAAEQAVGIPLVQPLFETTKLLSAFFPVLGSLVILRGILQVLNKNAWTFDFSERMVHYRSLWEIRQYPVEQIRELRLTRTKVLSGASIFVPIPTDRYRLSLLSPSGKALTVVTLDDRFQVMDLLQQLQKKTGWALDDRSGRFSFF